MRLEQLRELIRIDSGDRNVCADAVNDQRAKQEQKPVLQVAELAGAAYFAAWLATSSNLYSAATSRLPPSMAARAPLGSANAPKVHLLTMHPKEPLSQPMHRPTRPACLSDRRSISSIGNGRVRQANLDVAGTRQGHETTLRKTTLQGI